jgi:NADH:ubiquinone reductase (H+-translocating)
LVWTATLLFRREVGALGTLHDPRAEFRAAAVPPDKATAEPGSAAADPEVEATTDRAADEA